MQTRQTGFTLVEIAVVLLIVTILLGYTVALFPQQQRLKQYRAVEQEMDRVIEAIIGFAQVNGRLPCPAVPNSGGLENLDDDWLTTLPVDNALLPDGCFHYGGFVPANTLGLDGRFNEDSLLLDPWGNPYRYYVTNVDFNGNQLSDFTSPGEMRAVGLVDTESPNGDGYIDLDGRYTICDSAGTKENRCAGGAVPVFGRFTDGNSDPEDVDADDRFGGAPFVLLSMGENWSDVAPAGDELQNSGDTLSSAFTAPLPTMPNGPAGTPYVLKNVASGEIIFVRRPSGFGDDFDDVVRWVSPSILYSRMIQAGQLP